MSKPSVVLVSASYDHTIRVWDPATANPLKTIRVNESQVNALAVSPDKRYVAAACNPVIKIFDLTKPADAPPVAIMEGHTGNVTAVGFDQTGRWLYSGGADGTVRAWDPRTGQCPRTFLADVAKTDDWNDNRKSAINCVTLHPNQGELLVGDQGGRVRVCDLTSATSVVIATPEPDVAMRSLAIAFDGSRIFMATDSGKVHQWAPPSCESMLNVAEVVLKSFDAHDTYCLKCAVSPDLKYLATASADHTCKIGKFPTCELRFASCQNTSSGCGTLLLAPTRHTW